jgi:site-specific recombinase XerD
MGPPAITRDNSPTHSANTQRAYRSDWREFRTWADYRHLGFLPATPGTLALYLAHLGRVARTSTISRRLAAIADVHRAAGFVSPTEDPAVKAVWARIRRIPGPPALGATPLTVTLLRPVVEGLPDDLAGHRDRALLLVAFAGALRRSELVGLDVEDIEVGVEGLVVAVGSGRLVRLSYRSDPTMCPVRALNAWRRASGIDAGPLFRPVSRFGTLGRGRLSAASANRAVHRAMLRGGLDPAAYSARSLRAGGLRATSASRSGSRDPGWW